jgi:hypothetical protein
VKKHPYIRGEKNGHETGKCFFLRACKKIGRQGDKGDKELFFLILKTFYWHNQFKEAKNNNIITL